MRKDQVRRLKMKKLFIIIIVGVLLGVYAVSAYAETMEGNVIIKGKAGIYYKKTP